MDPLIIDLKTKVEEWTLFEKVTIQAMTLDQLVEQAQLYVALPEKHVDILTNRLTARTVLTNQEESLLGNHLNSINLDLYILKERSIKERNNLSISS